MIGAGGYLVVLADNPASPIPGAHFLHANFKLSGNGDFIGLYDESGVSQDRDRAADSQAVPVPQLRDRTWRWGLRLPRPPFARA